MVNAWKVGGGTGAIILGVYILFNQTSLSETIFGAIAIAFGIGLFASEMR